MPTLRTQYKALALDGRVITYKTAKRPGTGRGSTLIAGPYAPNINGKCTVTLDNTRCYLKLKNVAAN